VLVDAAEQMRIVQEGSRGKISLRPPNIDQ